MNKPFRFGVVVSYVPSHANWVTLARRAEELGYSTILMPDRPSLGGLALFSALGVAAQATTSLRVGSYVFANDYRHPVLLAKEAATLDLLSEGRFELGLGAGVSTLEFQQLGIPFANGGTRVGHLEETLQLVKRIFTEESVSFSGKYFTVKDIKGSPRPVQQPHMPILVAGGGEKMLKLAGREADIIAIGSKFTAQGPDPADAPLDQKIAWIKEVAGERFAQIELSQTVFDIQLTDSSVEPAPQAGGPPVPKRPQTTEQAVNRLLEERERYGFSYLQIYAGQMENFAPVVAQLSGK